MLRWGMAMWVVLVLAGSAGSARADEPWTTGVTAAQKATAQGLLEAGNTLFLQRDYGAALDKYRQAVAAWDHPAIRFNMVRCLIQLDRGVEAAENLKLALKYGAAPLEEAVYNEALAYEKLLANQIGDVEIRCEQPGVSITLDGQPLPACPGTQTRRVTPGRHQIVGSKEGFLTRTTEVLVLGGKREQVTVSLIPISSATTFVHRWPSWKPWLVLGSGLAVLGVGGLIEYQASQDMSSFDRSLTLVCGDTGCDASRPIPPNVADQKTRATHENDVAIGVLSVGFATAAAGGVLLYMNRGREAYPVLEKVAHALDRVDMSSTHGGGLFAVRGHF